jgi:hypothetical protein
MSRTYRHPKKYARIGSNPKWWDVLVHVRPHRRRVSRCLKGIEKGEDVDSIVWPKWYRPFIYWW